MTGTDRYWEVQGHGGNVWRYQNPESLHDFSASIAPDIPGWAMTALQTGLLRCGHYPDPALMAETEALAQFLFLPSQNVLPCAGGSAAIFALSKVPHHTALVPAPGFSEYAAMERGLGHRVESFPLPPEGKWELASLLSSLEAPSMVFLCSPHNPTGRIIPRDTLNTFLEGAGQRGHFVVVDEAFIHYCPENSIASQVRDYPNLIVLGSLTKILGIPGIRVGYLCAHKDLIPALRQGLIPWAVDACGSAVLRELPGHKDDFLRIRSENEQRRAHLAQALSQLCRVYPSQANFLLCQFDFSAESLRLRLERRGILVRSCLNFQGLGDRYLRIAVRGDAENALLVSCLKEEVCRANH